MNNIENKESNGEHGINSTWSPSSSLKVEILKRRDRRNIKSAQTLQKTLFHRIRESSRTFSFSLKLSFFESRFFRNHYVGLKRDKLWCQTFVRLLEHHCSEERRRSKTLRRHKMRTEIKHCEWTRREAKVLAFPSHHDHHLPGFDCTFTSHCLYWRDRQVSVFWVLCKRSPYMAEFFVFLLFVFRSFFGDSSFSLRLFNYLNKSFFE
jgi:hypothetical protein